MHKLRSKHSIITSTAILPLVLAMASVNVQAADQNSGYAQSSDVLVKNISFVGLQRLTPNTLGSILPITIGGFVNDDSLAASIKALFASEYFAKVDAKIEGNKVVFYVVERPIIASVDFDGNKLIPDESLEQGLKSIGLEKGKVLKQSTLVKVANDIQQQYISQGYYNSDVNVDQKLLEDNFATVDIEFVEGKPAEVVDINIIGNNYFSNQDIKDAFLLKETSWLNTFSKSDHYVEAKLEASLEKIKAMYYNAGFVRFSIDNKVINISEDKKKVYIELSVTEGGRYQFGDINFLGKHPFDALELHKLVNFRAADRYSQLALDSTTNALESHFGSEGYYFAKVRPMRQINDVTKTVDIDFYLDAARPVYVRNIRFDGNIKTKDEVLRREMRQMENALASTSNLQLSQTRLMRTGYFKDVKIDVRPVPNLPDQIDVVFQVQEQPTGSSSIAAGYSQSGGVTFQLDLSQRNFAGTGNSVSLGASRSETRDSYSLGYTDPYFTVDGVSQSLSGYYRKTKTDKRNVSKYVSDSMGGTLKYGYPVDENIRLNAGINVDRIDIVGGRWMGVSQVDEMVKDGAEADVFGYDKDSNFDPNGKSHFNFEKDYTTYNLLMGWDYSSLDQPVFPKNGMSHSVDLTLGFGDKQYQKLVYNGNIYQPVYGGAIARGYTKLGYGEDLPFYETFYAGGAGSVRGYKPSSLGPTSQALYDTHVDKSYVPVQVGGNAIATVGAELILPLPFKGDWTSKVRPALFVEGGQVFDTTDRENETFSYEGGEEVPLIKQDKEMRYSAGLGVTWYTAIGPISLSYAKPFNTQEGDKIDKVQFQIGRTF